jgi:zinc transport system permease protein
MMSEAPSWAEFVDGWELFRDPVLCSGIAGLVLGFLSAYIVLRRMVFVSAAVTQAAGLGVAVAFYAAIHWGIEADPSYGAVVFSLVTATILVIEPERIGLTREALLGLVFAVTGGAAILVGSRITQEANDIQAILFGTAVLVSPEDLRRVLVAAVLVMTFQLWWFRGLTFASFDPIAARVHGLPVRLLDITLLLSVGVIVGVSARALGALPVFALSTLPGTAALLLTRGHLLATFALATAFGITAGVGGYLLAFFRDYPVGSSQTVVAAVITAAAVLLRLALVAVTRLMAGRAAELPAAVED